MEVRTVTKLIDILTADYHVSGTLEMRGNPAVYLNDQTVDVFTILDATVTPLMPGTQVGEMQIARFYVPKNKIQVVLLDMAVQEAQLLPTRKHLVCFTDTYVVKGHFSTGPETASLDVFSVSPGPFFPAVDAEVVPLRPLTTEMGGETDLLYVRGDSVEMFYNPDEK